MRARAFMAGEDFARLRRRIAEIEGRPAGFDDVESFADKPGNHGNAGPLAVLPAPARVLLSPRRGGIVLPFGIPRLDRMLKGGLRRNALHEIRSATTRDATAATGFAAAILAGLAGEDDRPVLLVMEEAALRETGVPYGPGLDRFGFDSRRLVVVFTRRPDDALWVFEEGLRCSGLAAVLAEIGGNPRALDLTASRRLSLRARENGILALLLRPSGAAEPGAAHTRWLVEPRPAGVLDDFPAGIGAPAWRLTLERNRSGETGSFDVEWDHGRRAFAPAALPPLSLPGPSVPVDRPHLPREAGTVLALRRAS